LQLPFFKTGFSLVFIITFAFRTTWRLPRLLLDPFAPRSPLQEPPDFDDPSPCCFLPLTDHLLAQTLDPPRVHSVVTDRLKVLIRNMPNQSPNQFFYRNRLRFLFPVMLIPVTEGHRFPIIRNNSAHRDCRSSHVSPDISQLPLHITFLFR